MGIIIETRKEQIQKEGRKSGMSNECCEVEKCDGRKNTKVWSSTGTRLQALDPPKLRKQP
jgi:hypothetical protein